MAAERKLKDEQYSQALKLFELSRVSQNQNCAYNFIYSFHMSVYMHTYWHSVSSQYPSSYIIERFSEIERVPVLVQYLHQLVYDDTPGHTSVSYPAHVQNILLKCFIHEVRLMKIYIHNYRVQGLFFT